MNPIDERVCLLREIVFLHCSRKFWLVSAILAAYGGHVIVLDPVKWAMWRRQSDSLQQETQALLFSS